MKKYTTILVATLLGSTIFALSLASPATAFPHALKFVDVNVHGHEKQILIVIGHTNEPTFGANNGIHDGKHHVEVFLEDGATALPIPGATLNVDKYFFSDLKRFKDAKSANSGQVQTDIALGGVFGDPGHYISRQIQKAGIYGYRLFGTIDYFGEATIQINETVFCSLREGEGDSLTTKFNSPGWFGGYGCTENVKGILFPASNPSVRSTSITSDFGDSITQAGLAVNDPILSYETIDHESQNTLALQALFLGVSGAAVAGFFGIRKFREHSRDQ